jgi:hypothetical protein
MYGGRCRPGRHRGEEGSLREVLPQNLCRAYSLIGKRAPGDGWDHAEELQWLPVAVNCRLPCTCMFKRLEGAGRQGVKSPWYAVEAWSILGRCVKALSSCGCYQEQAR